MNTMLTKRAYDLIKRDLIACVLEPGKPIVQMQLARKYGIGVTPIREALHRLSGAGLVDSVPGIGFIAPPITLSDLQELFDLRLTLELAAARLAILHATDEQLRAIADRASFRYTYRDESSYETFLAQNAEFHCSVAEAAGSRRLADAITRVLDELSRVFHLSLALRDSSEEKLRAHQELARALCERDLEQAEQCIADEIAATRARVWEAVTGRVASRIALSTA